MSDCFRIPAVVDIAWLAKRSDDELPPVPASMGTPLADRARAATSRVGRAQYEVRDALGAVLEAVGGLEREVQRLSGLLSLRDRGIELRRELVHVGPDALVLQRRLGVPSGVALHVLLEIRLWEARQLLVLSGVADGETIRLVDTPRDVREVLVAFTFQQETQQRRRLARSS